MLTNNVTAGNIMHMIENNLREMITQYKRDNPMETIKSIAAKKGVTPETVSRHQSDKIDMSMQDIRDYATILDCSTFDIMYRSQPIPIVAIGSCVDEDEWISYTHALTPDTAECLYLHSTHEKNLGACRFEFPAEYQGRFKWMDGCYEIFDVTPCIDRSVSKDAVMRPCIVRTIAEELFCGTLYPQPGSHKYSLVQSSGKDNKILNDLELEWAAPVLRYLVRPDLAGAEVVKSCNNAYALERTTLMYQHMNDRRKQKGMSLL